MAGGLLDRFQVEGTTIGPEDPDAAAAASGRYGTHKDAQAVIEANFAQFPEEVVAVGTLPVNDELTEELDLEQVAKLIPDEGTLESANVRKGVNDDEAFVMAIYTVESGRSARCVFPLSSLGKSKAKAKPAASKPASKPRSRKSSAKPKAKSTAKS